MHNIEKSAFQKGMYVGYGGGAVWHIRNYGKGNWKATPQGNNKHQVFSCATLRDVSTQLETLSAKPMDANLTSARKANPAPRKRDKTYEIGFTHGMTGATSAYMPGNRKPGSESFIAYSEGFQAGFYQAGEEKRRPGQINYGRGTNPAPRKRAISRPSQVTKKAPSNRLVARRKVAAKKPVKGYFPNPGISAKTKARWMKENYDKFAPVEIQINTGAGWILYAAACDGESAKKLAKDLATLPKFKNVAIRVMG